MSTTTSGQISNQVNNDGAVAALHQVMAQQRKCHEENSALRLLYKQLKADGHDVGAMRTAIKYKRQDTPIAVGNIQATLRYSGLLGMPVSPETLFDNMDFTINEKTQASQDIWDAEEGGYQAGRHGVKIEECPYLQGTEQFVEWRKWWHKGQEAAVMAMGTNTTEARAARRPRRRQAEMPLNNGGSDNLSDTSDKVADIGAARAARKKAAAPARSPGRPRGRPPAQKKKAAAPGRRPRRAASPVTAGDGAAVY